ncbi:MAG TPA: amidohydrolase family protein [Azospirillaceae bacterium]|nr:amidohydrolase family protein [Azospirillaceae bacterium]
MTAAATAPAAEPERDAPLLVRAGRMFDSESGQLLPGRDILVRGDRIEQVGERLELPPDGRLLDLSGYTVLPGLIDGHTHLMQEHPGDEGSGETGVREIVREGEVLRALRGAARARTYLEAGFTSLRDLGNAGRFGDTALKRALAEGTLPGPRLHVSGPGLSPSGGQFDGIVPQHQDLVGHEYRVVRGPDDARVAVREAAVQGVDHIKIFSNGSPLPTYLSVAEMRAIVEEAHLHGLKVTAHATTDPAIGRALDAGVDAIEHGRAASPATLARMKEMRVPLVLTEWGKELIDIDIERAPPHLRPSAVRIDAIMSQSRGRVAAALKAGVDVAFGSDMYVDFGISRGRAALTALDAYVEGGMTPAAALRSATFLAGRLIAPDRLGVIKPGAYADLIAVEGDPTADLQALERLRCVLLGGKLREIPGAVCR